MGASNPHPHGQIWATEHLPDEPARELTAQRNYFAEHKSSLLMDYLKLEIRQRDRIVAENDSWVALVPFWAVWPFELLVLPRNSTATLNALNRQSRLGLGAILRAVTSGYNRVFNTPFPYSMGFHPAPCDGAEHPEWQLHAHFYPPSSDPPRSANSWLGSNCLVPLNAISPLSRPRPLSGRSWSWKTKNQIHGHVIG